MNILPFGVITQQKNIFFKKDLFLIIFTKIAQTHKLRKLSQWQENTRVNVYTGSKAIFS